MDRLRFIIINRLQRIDTDRLKKIISGRHNIFSNYYIVAAIIIIGMIMTCGLFKVSSKVSSASADQKQKLISVNIEEGDTLWDIASEHYTSQFGSVKKYVKVIKETNSLKSDHLIPDTKIAVPVYDK